MRILFLSPWFPFPPSNGSKIRIYHLLLALSSKYEVDLISCIRKGEEVDFQGIDRFTRSIATVPWREYKPSGLRAKLGLFSPTPRYFYDTYNSDLAELIKENIQKDKPNVIIASEIATARYLKNNQEIPIIVDDLELGAFIAEKQFGNPTSYRQALTWKKMKNYVGNVVRHCSACTVVSDMEKDHLKKCVSFYKNIYVVPNGVDCHDLQPGQASNQPKKLIFNGSLTFRANYEAVLYFLQDIYPLVRQNLPDVQFFITGSTKDVDLKPLLLDSSVHLTGHLPDIHKAVASSSVCVVPIRTGGGTRLKILEAMALGIPVVSTAKGAEGIQVTSGKNILLGDKPQEFAHQVLRLLQEPDLSEHIAQNARNLVEEMYCWEAITPKFLALVDQFAKAPENK